MTPTKTRVSSAGAMSERALGCFLYRSKHCARRQYPIPLRKEMPMTKRTRCRPASRTRLMKGRWKFMYASPRLVPKPDSTPYNPIAPNPNTSMVRYAGPALPRRSGAVEFVREDYGGDGREGDVLDPVGQ